LIVREVAGLFDKAGANLALSDRDVWPLKDFAAGLTGIPRIRTSVQLLKLFDSESRIIADYAYLEEHFGKLVPMEVVIRVPPEMLAARDNGETDADQAASVSDAPAPAHRLNVLQRAQAVARIDTAVQRTLGDGGTGVIGQTMSAATFLPPLPDPARGYDVRRGITQARLAASLEELAKSDYYRVEKQGPFAGSELWRLSLRVGALSDVDYGRAQAGEPGVPRRRAAVLAPGATPSASARGPLKPSSVSSAYLT
jgi:hypothetical protein